MPGMDRSRWNRVCAWVVSTTAWACSSKRSIRRCRWRMWTWISPAISGRRRRAVAFGLQPAALGDPIAFALADTSGQRLQLADGLVGRLPRLEGHALGVVQNQARIYRIGLRPLHTRLGIVFDGFGINDHHFHRRWPCNAMATPRLYKPVASKPTWTDRPPWVSHYRTMAGGRIGKGGLPRAGPEPAKATCKVLALTSIPACWTCCMGTPPDILGSGPLTLDRELPTLFMQPLMARILFGMAPEGGGPLSYTRSMPSDACGLPRADGDRTWSALHNARGKPLTPRYKMLRFAQHDTGRRLSC